MNLSSSSYLSDGQFPPNCQDKKSARTAKAPAPLASDLSVTVKPETPAKRQEKSADGTKDGSCRQWQSKPGKHGGRLLKGRSGAPGKKPCLANPDALMPSERNLEAESQIRDIQSALLLWQREVTRGRQLSDRAVTLLQFFIAHCRRNPRKKKYLRCWYTVERIADLLCMGKRTVERAIADLKGAGILLGERERYENGKFGYRYFWILTPPDLTKYAPKPAETPNRHLTVSSVGAPNRHLTVVSGGALEEGILEQTSKKAEAEKRHAETVLASPVPTPASPPPADRHQQTVTTRAVEDEDVIQRLQRRLKFFIKGLIPEDHELAVWGMDTGHVQEAVREVASGVRDGVSPVKSLLNLRRTIQANPLKREPKAVGGCRKMFSDHTYLPTDPVVQSVPQQPATEDRRKVEERASARIKCHQDRLRQILDPVLDKDHALCGWSMDPEHVSNALRAVSRGMQRGESPVTALALLARSGDYISRTDQILACRMELGRARNNLTEACPIDWQGRERWIDDVIQVAPELVYELFMQAKSRLRPGRDLFRGVVINVCELVRDQLGMGREGIAMKYHPHGGGEYA